MIASISAKRQLKQGSGLQPLTKHFLNNMHVWAMMSCMEAAELVKLNLHFSVAN